MQLITIRWVDYLLSFAVRGLSTLGAACYSESGAFRQNSWQEGLFVVVLVVAVVGKGGVCFWPILNSQALAKKNILSLC